MAWWIYYCSSSLKQSGYVSLVAAVLVVIVVVLGAIVMRWLWTYGGNLTFLCDVDREKQIVGTGSLLNFQGCVLIVEGHHGLGYIVAVNVLLIVMCPIGGIIAVPGL